jgi:hypothetical protein
MVEALEDRLTPSILTVNTALDEFDGGTLANPAGPDGQLSLREAISAASSGDQITFDSSLSGSTINLDPTKGELLINTNLSIIGLGAVNLAVNGQHQNRVFEIAAGASDTISGLTIENGFETNDIFGGSGGGILNWGTLTVSGSTLTGNSAIVQGGGIFNYGGGLTVSGSTLSDNSATSSTYGYGGGIVNIYGTVTVTGSALSGNSATHGGGGIANEVGTLTVIGSTLSGNSANAGGGIFNLSGTVTVSNFSTISGNSAGYGGGGIFNESGPLNITDSTICGNAAAYGADLADAFGGTVTLTNSDVCVINQTITTTTVTSSSSTPVFGQAVTFTATVSSVVPVPGTPTPGTPTGTVTFQLDGSTTLGVVTLDSSGKATFTTAGLSVGPHTITAIYSGDANSIASTGVLPGTITTVAGNGTSGYSGNGGSATAAQLNLPIGVAVDAAGDLFIADTFNHVVREVSPAGIITTVAGNGTAGYSGDGGAATAAQLNYSFAVTVDAAGDLFIADTVNNVIREVRAGIITTVAGNGVGGYSGDGGAATAAELFRPSGVAVDAAGDLFIADGLNNVIREVRAGIITTVAGNDSPGYSGDGGAATAAQLADPAGVAVDAAGDLFIADYNNNVIREVRAGIITTVAGNGTAGYSGDGGPATAATLNSPPAVAVDAGGDLFIADNINNVIREVVHTGNIITVAGNFTAGAGYSGDGGPATSATLNNPTGVAVNAAGDLFIADASNNVIREVTPSLTVLSAQQEIGLTVNQVNAVVTSGALSSGNGNALTTKLNSAVTNLNGGYTTAGVNQLNAFINQVTAFQKNGKLTNDQAQSLISAANLAITAASGGSGAHLTNQDAPAASGSADTQPVSDAGQLVTGTIGVYLDNADGTPVSSDEQARFDDAIQALDTTFGSYGVNLVDVGATDAADAIVQVEIAATSAAGSAADGVLGCTVAGHITLLTGWNWYTSADPSAISAGQYDFETIVTHELGHAIGLGHSGDTSSVMYPYLASGVVSRAVTTQDMSVLEAATGTTPEPLLAAPWRETPAAAPATFTAPHLVPSDGVGPPFGSGVGAVIGQGMSTSDLARNLFFALLSAAPDELPLGSRQLSGRSTEPGRMENLAGRDAFFGTVRAERLPSQNFESSGATYSSPIFAGAWTDPDDDVPLFPDASQPDDSVMLVGTGGEETPDVWSAEVTDAP